MSRYGLIEAVPDLGALLFAVEELGHPHALASDDHGPRHWRDVAMSGLWLAGREPRARLDVVFAFALCHDARRHNDFSDPGHGQRGAELARELQGRGVLCFNADGAALLDWACRHHTKSGPVADPTTGVCLDADRLTLGRVGIEPDNRYLSTAAGRSGIAKHFAENLITGEDTSWQELHRGYNTLASVRAFA